MSGLLGAIGMHLLRLDSPGLRSAARTLAIAAIVAAASTAAHADAGVTVRFVVTDLDGTDGRVLCGLYKNQDRWLTPEYFKGVEGKPRSDGNAVCVFDNVQPGVYAISAFHDENDNENLDTGLFGLPKEDYCASNDAYRRFGPPQWEDATFRVGSKSLRMSAPVH